MESFFYLQFVKTRIMSLKNIKMDVNEIMHLESKCLDQIAADYLYEVRNDAKLRAVYSTQSYEEFKDIVDAAHLQSLTKDDKQNTHTKNRLWNPSVRDNDYKK